MVWVYCTPGDRCCIQDRFQRILERFTGHRNKTEYGIRETLQLVTVEADSVLHCDGGGDGSGGGGGDGGDGGGGTACGGVSHRQEIVAVGDSYVGGDSGGGGGNSGGVSMTTQINQSALE
ncbi:hypothetical protein M0802_001514 [Mischocyttarus mexicanus]|nr:hypothetical protein M0802_001514 [Mischocyttarus mexicanus]